jgi:hypothetical protein
MTKPPWLESEPGWKFAASLRLAFYAKHKIMKKAIIAKQKRGRPATGITPMIGFRADPELRKAIEQWAKSQPDKPRLSDAVRRLVELGLKAKK